MIAYSHHVSIYSTAPKSKAVCVIKMTRFFFPRSPLNVSASAKPLTIQPRNHRLHYCYYQVVHCDRAFVFRLVVPRCTANAILVCMIMRHKKNLFSPTIFVYNFILRKQTTHQRFVSVCVHGWVAWPSSNGMAFGSR